ncbi:MAG: DNA-3-methyladenine glycosylase 2 family protein [bacterium]|nr:DNA-3-methyladenine glycosylase 2 family protein [bacterium]
MHLDRAICERALRARDARFDGRFFTAVKTTGIYCRPICPARMPQAKNVRFLPTAAACEALGFRPCRRCRPETAPGTPAWAGSSTTVNRALQLIQAGALDSGSVDDLAARLGVGARHLRRLFTTHLGATPNALARTRRAHFARRLLDETEWPMADVALAAGFGSLRQFNDTLRQTFLRTPSELRRLRRGVCAPAGEACLRLPYRAPLDFPDLLSFLAPRLLPGVETIDGGRYRRAVTDDAVPGWLEVEPSPNDSANDPALRLRCVGISPVRLVGIVERVRRMFDLAADPARVAEDLAGDSRLAHAIAARPGLRVPGAYEPFEMAVRVVLGQQVWVKGATTRAGRLIRAAGKPVEGLPEGLDWAFPSPEDLARTDVASIGMPGGRARAVNALAEAVAEGRVRLGGEEDPDAVQEALCQLPGIGPWTAQVIALRALGDPDVFPAGDLGLRKALGTDGNLATEREANARAQAWRPWRAYAALWLWTEHANGDVLSISEVREAKRRRERPRLR